MVEQEYIKCPVCDSSLNNDCDSCPRCGLTRGLMKMDEDLEGGIEHNIPDNIEDMAREVLENGEEDILKVFKGFNHSGKSTNEEELVEEVVFECPLCSTEVEEEEDECPGCGALFE